MIAGTAAPENKFGFGHPQEPDLLIWFIFITLIFIFVSMLLIFAKNMLATSENINLQPERYALWTSYLKTASTCSILIGLIGILVGIYRTLIAMALSGVYSLDGSIGPNAETLVFLILGISIACLGYGLEFVCRWKSVVATNK